MHKIISISVFLLTFLPSTVFATEYKFVSISGLIEQEVGRLIIPEIYKKAGHVATITPMPGKRAQQQATSGMMDGEIMRIWTYGKNNPTTLRVPTPYYSLETMAFAKKDSKIVIAKKEDLKAYTLAKVRGVKHTNNITKGLKNVRDTGSTRDMMQALSADRIQVALTNTVDGKLVLKEMGLTDIQPMAKPLAVLDLYHYIHEDHKHLVPTIDGIIKKMAENGELAQIIQRAEQKIIGNN